MLRRIVAAIAAAWALSIPCGGAQTNPDIQISTILPVTGPAGFIGKGIARSLGMVEQVVNGQGGIGGRHVHFAIADDQSNPQVDVQLVNQVVAQSAAVLLGPSTTGGCNAVAPLVQEKGPVLYCLSPGILPPPNGFVFSANTATRDAIAALVRFFRESGDVRIAALTSIDATGQEVDRAIERAAGLPENRSVRLIAHEHFNVGDVTVAAQIARIKAADPQVLIAWTNGTSFATLLRGVADAGLDIPVGASNANMVYAQLREYKAFMPSRVFFPGALSLVEGAVSAGPVRAAQEPYFRAFRQIGVTPDNIDMFAWDPAMLLVDALRKLGPAATSVQVRDYILRQRSWVGINGTYNFTDGSQRGVGDNNVLIERWDAAASQFVVASKPGGRLR